MIYFSVLFTVHHTTIPRAKIKWPTRPSSGALKFGGTIVRSDEIEKDLILVLLPDVR
jgi:hypothetical protein